MLGFEQRSHAGFALSQFTRNLAAIDTDLEAERDEARDRAKTATELIRSYNKQYRDDNSQKPTIYQEGDYVLVRDAQARAGENVKLKPKYKGPYEVAKSLEIIDMSCTTFPASILRLAHTTLFCLLTN